MSESKEELVDRALEPFNRGDTEAIRGKIAYHKGYADRDKAFEDARVAG